MTDRDRRPSSTADVCVIGAGPAGAFVAYSLASRGHDVVILEAGQWYDADDRWRILETWLRPDFDRNAFWIDESRDAYTSTGDIYARVNKTRVKAVGGSSQLWSANTPRLHEKDFEMNTRYGLATDWPITYQDLQPYYATAEREMGVSGDADNPFGPPREHDFPLAPFPPSYSDRLFATACEELGIETHAQPKAITPEPYGDRPGCDGYGACNACPIGARYTADVHIRKAQEHGARVIDRAQVLELTHDESGEYIEAIRYATPDGDRHEQAADHVVLACGGIETPRLLLLSDSPRYPDGLANSSGTVGHYLMDHPHVETRGRIQTETRQGNIGFVTTRSDQFYTHEDPTPGSFYLTFSNTAISAHAGSFEKSPAITHALSTLATPSLESAAVMLTDPFGASAFGDDLVSETNGYPLSIRGVGEMLPDPSNRVSLDPDTTDKHGRPVPRISIADGSHARETMDRCLEVQADIMSALGARITGVSTLADREMGTHHMGTTRMGTDPTTSVVTPQCRTHDLQNCWIASSSVFPTGGAMNPTLTIVALALKTADHLEAQL